MSLPEYTDFGIQSGFRRVANIFGVDEAQFRQIHLVERRLAQSFIQEWENLQDVELAKKEELEKIR